MDTYVLVAGVDYEFKGVSFREFCDNRRKQIVAANHRHEELFFVTVDFRKGKIETHTVTYPDGKRTEVSGDATPAGIRGITKADYDRSTDSDGETHFRLKKGLSDILSVLNVYAVVRAIGADPARQHTLKELSFFAHGFYGGPVLVNSFDDEPSAARDGDDKDPRASKDFIAPTMDAAALKEFGDAFHSDGYTWIWGCAFPRTTHEILWKIEHSKQYKPLGLTDESVLEVGFNAAQATQLAGWLTGLVSFPTDGRKKVSIKFKYLRHYFCMRSVGTYAFQIASNTGRDAFSAVIGTYADYDDGSRPLMHIHRGFGRHLAFYKNYLGFGFDPEKRGYGRYEPTLSCTPPAPEPPAAP